MLETKIAQASYVLSFSMSVLYAAHLDIDIKIQNLRNTASYLLLLFFSFKTNSEKQDHQHELPT